ncbi:tRNA threonylcarbamoyladenosine dehydratase [Clostridiales bacterium]|nr:tRNA threonylcarbamoyladenosine dehydratase [Clostridiales bacterium]
MNDRFSRTRQLIGQEAVSKLWQSRVAVFGIGGVGGYVCEALARAGLGAMDLIDKDQVDVTNINRQIIASNSTIGRDKVEVMKERILDMDPEIQVETYKCFFLPDTKFDFTSYDYVVDAVDTVTAKVELIVRARQAGVPVISSMGTGNKLDPGRFQIAPIGKTSVCPLAKVMRRELKKRGITDVKVLYSTEEPVKQVGRSAPASISFVPSAAGLMIAGEVVRDLINRKDV